MRVHVFQHAPFEGLGSIRGWLNDRGAEVRYTRFFTGDPLPVLDELDMLIAMGGPMSVNDEADHPWLKGEKQAMREAIAMDMPVLGVCLGAQLIASALGARVYPNAVKEIGWFPIQGVQGAESGFAFPSDITVFHWHGETFDLPDGAIHLAMSEACAHQAFLFKRNVVGSPISSGDDGRWSSRDRRELSPRTDRRTVRSVGARTPRHSRVAIHGDERAHERDSGVLVGHAG